MTADEQITSEQSMKILSENMDKIRKNMKRIMNERKITQDELAYVLDSTQPYINYLLNKRGANTTVDMMGKIAVALETTMKGLVE